ncbi:DUF1289 domain-containing protein [Novipirellula galeiformis]|uniref:DUF1289 domain-containing protein n=1 Tax=Novipirellula galeiformis TaxID=2528004 RepID=UPI0011B52055|nr:DUF1289 domain-containing protein [Novipirellula galeiformis]
MNNPCEDEGRCVASPCIGTCVLDQSDLCVGCFRSRMEIACWGAAAEVEKQRILQQSLRRRQARESSAS